MSEPPQKTAAGDAIERNRPAVATSFRFHRPRGPVCARGYCSQCEIQTPDGPALACQLPASSAPDPHRDLLRPLGKMAERFPPWFYERRFLRPRALTGPALHAIRYLSGAHALPDQIPDLATKNYLTLTTETVIVGDADEPGAYHVDLADGRLALGLYPDRTLLVLDDETLTAVHFERLILATGAYDRLPPIPGNDLPGLIGLPAMRIYGRARQLPPSARVAIWGPAGDLDALRSEAEDYGLQVVWSSDRLPTRISGSGRVQAIEASQRIACDLFITAVSQPAIDLALQGGADAQLSSDGLAIVALTQCPDWMEVRGRAAAQSSGVPDLDTPVSGEAYACMCEDVRVKDLQGCVAQGFADPELVKRRTGAMTGPCQGKLCAADTLSALRACGLDAKPTRSRPVARPVTLGELAADA